jgi:micrococcal nuclease
VKFRAAVFGSAVSLVAIVSACAAGSPVPQSFASPLAVSATVLRAVDGDTVDVVDEHPGTSQSEVVGLGRPGTAPAGLVGGMFCP